LSLEHPGRLRTLTAPLPQKSLLISEPTNALGSPNEVGVMTVTPLTETDTTPHVPSTKPETDGAGDHVESKEDTPPERITKSDAESAEEENDDDETEEDDEPPTPLAIANRPKRQRKQVSRLGADVEQAEEKTFEPPEGEGTKIADMPNIITQLHKSSQSSDQVKFLHALFYKIQGKVNVRKRHIRLFNGWEPVDGSFDKMETFATQKLTKLNKAMLAQMTRLLNMDLKSSAPKDDYVEMLVTFCKKPDVSLCSESTIPLKKTRAKKKTKKKKARKPRLPGPYALFVKENSKSIRAANPDKHHTEMMGLIAKSWAEASEEVKQEFTEKAKALKADAEANPEKYPIPEKKTKKKRKRTASKKTQRKQKKQKTGNDADDEDDEMKAPKRKNNKKRKRAGNTSKRAKRSKKSKAPAADDVLSSDDEGSASRIGVDPTDADQVDIGLAAIIGQQYCEKHFGASPIESEEVDMEQYEVQSNGTPADDDPTVLLKMKSKIQAVLSEGEPTMKLIKQALADSFGVPVYKANKQWVKDEVKRQIAAME